MPALHRRATVPSDRGVPVGHIRCWEVRRAPTGRLQCECASTTVYLVCHSHDEHEFIPRGLGTGEYGAVGLGGHGGGGGVVDRVVAGARFGQRSFVGWPPLRRDQAHRRLYSTVTAGVFGGSACGGQRKGVHERADAVRPARISGVRGGVHAAPGVEAADVSGRSGGTRGILPGYRRGAGSGAGVLVFGAGVSALCPRRCVRVGCASTCLDGARGGIVLSTTLDYPDGIAVPDGSRGAGTPVRGGESAVSRLGSGMQPLSVFAPHAPTRAHWRRDRAHRQMKRLFHRVMQERRQRYAAEAERAQREERDGQVAVDAVKEADMLQTFMDATYKSGKPLSDDEITGLLIAVLFAGQHTSTITGSWTGLLALRDAAVVQQLHEEQAQVLVDERGQFAIDYDRLLRLDRLHRCIKEALRMYPPLIFIMRQVMQPRQYQQYTIPTGDILVVSPSISMRLPQVFAEPDRYDPERYAPPREEDKQAPFSHIGFGGGRHACMGEQFAYLQIKTIWSVLLRDFDMEAVGALPQPDYEAMVVGPKPPCLVRWRRRERNGGNV
eukprot:ctg_1418.g492